MRILLLWCLIFFEGNAIRCHFCGYHARNCSDDDAVPSVRVCNEDGRIQQDDLFCGTDKCTCADGYNCVSLEVGCQSLLMHKPSRRCVSQHSLDFRFRSCAGKIENAPEVSNLEMNWLYFNDVTQCNTTDCLAAQQFVQCNNVECGHMVTGWKTESEYHFIVDGYRASDMSAGEFHYTVPFDANSNSIDCAKANSTIIENCYMVQSRNVPSGKCIGVYYQQDAVAQDDSSGLSDLPWPVWIAVVASSVGALATLIIAAVIFYRQRNAATDEETDVMLTDVVTPSAGTSSQRESTLRHRNSNSPIREDTESTKPVLSETS